MDPHGICSYERGIRPFIPPNDSSDRIRGSRRRRRQPVAATGAASVRDRRRLVSIRVPPVRDGDLRQPTANSSTLTLTTPRRIARQGLAKIERFWQHLPGTTALSVQMRAKSRALVKETTPPYTHHLTTRSGESTHDYRLQKWLGETPTGGDDTGSPTSSLFIAFSITITIHGKFARLYHDMCFVTFVDDGQRPILGAMG